MTVRTFLAGSTLTAVCSTFIWLLILFFLNPEQAGWVGYILFLLSLFLMVASLAGLLGYGLRRLVNAQRLAAYSVRTSLRQGLLLGIFFTLLMFLVRIRLYQWWIALALTLICVFIELIFLSYDRSLDRRTAGH